MNMSSKPKPMQIDTYVSLHTGETVFTETFKNFWGNILRVARSGDYSQDLHVSLLALCKEGTALPDHHKKILEKHSLPTSSEEFDVHKRSIIIAAHANCKLIINPSDPKDLTGQFILKPENIP